jgi:hypothetical protein
MASTPFFSANSRSSESFSVSEGTRTGMPGRLMPLFSPSMPPLMISQTTSSPIHFVDAQLDEAVGEQNARALLDVFRQGLEGGADQGCGAGNIARRDGEPLAGLEQHRLVIFQLGGADLGSLQVAQDAQRLALFAAHLCGSSGSAPASPRGCHGKSSGEPHRRRRGPGRGRRARCWRPAREWRRFLRGVGMGNRSGSSSAYGMGSCSKKGSGGKKFGSLYRICATRFIVHGGLGPWPPQSIFIKYARREMRWSVQVVTRPRRPDRIWPEAGKPACRSRKRRRSVPRRCRTLNAVM